MKVTVQLNSISVLMLVGRKKFDKISKNTIFPISLETTLLGDYTEDCVQTDVQSFSDLEGFQPS